MGKQPSLTSRIRTVGGISAPYASQLATGARTPSLKTALRIYHALGLSLGPLKDKSRAEIARLEKALDTIEAA